MRPGTQTRWRAQRGQTVVEAAFVFPLIFLVVLFVFELGWLMYTYSVMADAVNEGVRYAIVHSGGDPAGTQAKVKTFAATSLHNISAMTPLVTFPDGTTTPPSRVRVTITYTYIPYLPKFINAPTMKTYAEGRMVVQ